MNDDVNGGERPRFYIIAKILRVVTLPPVLLIAMIAVLYFTDTATFGSYYETLAAIFFLGVFPILAYPVHLAVPQLRRGGRSAQRKLAFVFNLAGYTGGLLYGIFGGVTPELLFIFIAYFVSVVLLTFVNKVIKIRASGHACGSVAPCFVLAYFCKWYCVFPCLAIFAASAWASVYLKRHKLTELLLGGAVFALSFSVMLPLYIYVL